MVSRPTVLRLATGCTLALTSPAIAQAAPRDTAAINAAVRVAKATYAEVERALGSERLVRSDTSTDCDEKLEWSVSFEFYRDSAGVTRLLDWKGGSDDTGSHSRYYYDAGGRLRFAYFVYATVHDEHYEERLYLDDRGVVVRRVAEWEKGAPRDTHGWFTPVPDPAAYLKNFCERVAAP